MTLAAMLTIAATIWGGTPAALPACAPTGSTSVHDAVVIHWHAELVADENTLGLKPGTKLAGWARPATCEVALALDVWRGQSRAEDCDLVAHELGHVFLGVEWATEELVHAHPGMDVGHRYRACHRRARPLRRRSPDPYRFDSRR